MVIVFLERPDLEVGEWARVSVGHPLLDPPGMPHGNKPTKRSPDASLSLGQDTSGVRIAS